MAKRNSTKKSRKSQCCASETVIKSAELNNIHRIVSGKIADDFIVRNAIANNNHIQKMFHEINLPFQMSNIHTDIVITDEMVQRVLAPVLWMIREGKFDRPSKA